MSKPFQTKALADLYWILHTPLMIKENSTLLPALVKTLLDQGLTPLFDQLNDDATPLLQYLEDRPTHRLGVYFEHLLAFALLHSPHYQLIKKGLQVISEKKTLGEMDFLIQPTHTQKPLHLEVAIKFYLGTGTTEWTQWIGPNPKDTLHKKTQHLLNHQTQLSQRKEAYPLLQSMGLEKPDTGIFLKGCFYCPMPQPGEQVVLPIDCGLEQPTGYWIRWKRFEEQLPEDRQWRLLKTKEWLPSRYQFPKEEYLSKKEIKQALSARFETDAHPVLLSELRTNTSHPVQIFVVPESWPHQTF